MKLNFLDYVNAGNKEAFEYDFALTAVDLFSQHGLALVLSDNARSIYDSWISTAGEWSMSVPENGSVRRVPDPSCLSHIKHAGILAHTIFSCSPISTFDPLSVQQKATLLDVGISFGDTKSELLTEYPHQMLALTVVDALFARFQSAREGEHRVDWATPPMTKHFRKNLCVLLEKRRISAEAMYMIYKTMDMYGFIPE